MNLLLDILLNFLGSACLSILLTIAGVCMLFFLIKGFYPKYTYSLISIIVGIILFFFLLIQSILLCGALEIKSMSETLEIKIHQNIPSYYEGSQAEISSLEVQQLLNNLIDDCPVLGYYVDTAEFIGYNYSNITEAFIDELNWFLTKYIWKRIGWSFLFIVVGTFIVVKTMNGLHTPIRKINRMSRGGSSVTPIRTTFRNRRLR
jgi:hypothetical protein